MTRATANTFDEKSIDKSILLNLELKRHERRRNLRYRDSAVMIPDADVRKNKVWCKWTRIYICKKMQYTGFLIVFVNAY